METAERTQNYSKQVRNLLLGLFLLALCWFLKDAHDFVLPILLGLFIAITFRPGIRSLARYRVPEWLAASGFMITFVSAGLFTAYSIASPIAAFTRDAPIYAQKFASKLHAIQMSLESLSRFAEKIEATATPASGVATQEVVVRAGPPIAYLGQITGYSMNIVATTVLTSVIAAFLMASGDLFYAKLGSVDI